MHIQIDASDLVKLSEAWKRAPEMVIEELTRATYEAEMLLERETKELTPVGVHNALRGSIHSQMPEVLGNTVIGVVGSPMKYAQAVELGREPGKWVGYEGVAAIEDWVRHKLGIPAEEAERVANAVAWKIHLYGTPAVGMFHRALAYNQTRVGAMFETAAGRIGQRLAGAV